MGQYTLSEHFSPMFERAIKEGFQKCEALWPITQRISFHSCTGKSRNGYCRKVTDTSYQIFLNKNLLNEKEIMGVVVHEILHSYPGLIRQGHKGEWARRAAIMNKTYGLTIQRCNTLERIKQEPKYQFQCSRCKRIWNYAKTPKWIDYIHNASCPTCKTHTIIIIKGPQEKMVSLEKKKRRIL